jgi:hypothetical protein
MSARNAGILACASRDLLLRIKRDGRSMGAIRASRRDMGLLPLNMNPWLSPRRTDVSSAQKSQFPMEPFRVINCISIIATSPVKLGDYYATYAIGG